QQLKRDPRATAIAGDERGRGSEIATGARSADGDARRIDPQLRGVVRDPANRRIRVLDRTRELCLRCEPVADRDHDASRAIRERTTRAVRTFQGTDGPPA